jgi:hypothetical protein
VSALEDRLRRELRAESEQITPDGLPPWGPPARTGRGRRLLSLAYGGGERQGALVPGWRGWLTPAAAAIVVAAVIAGAAVLSDAMFRPKAPGPTPSAVVGASPSASAAVAANEAVTWILHQVSRTAIVSCDQLVCGALARGGFLNLDPLEPTLNDPLGSTLVVATADIRARYGSRLASVYAPVIIASFGSGSASVDIRWAYPGGTAAYNADERSALVARKANDIQLLKNRRIAVSAKARAQLRSGGIDPLLPPLLAEMAHYHPLRIVDFVNQSPGGGPASLLRSVDLATAHNGTHLTPAAYVRWVHVFLDAQRALYRPAWSEQVRLRTGQVVLRIGYYAPSPLSQSQIGTVPASEAREARLGAQRHDAVAGSAFRPVRRRAAPRRRRPAGLRAAAGRPVG